MNRLKLLREKKDITQRELADFLNLTPKAISFYELGQRDIPNETLAKLADYFHVSTDYLLGRDTLGEYLRLARQHVSYAPEYVEVLTKIKADRIILFEKNAARPSNEELENLSTAYHVPVDIMTGKHPTTDPRTYQPRLTAEEEQAANMFHSKLFKMNETKRVPVIGVAKCGANMPSYEELQEYITIDDTYRPDEMRGFRAEGDSMEPEIHDGDICLVHLQEEVPDGALAVVVICDGEESEGTVKRIHKQDGAIILQATNQAYAPRIFTGENANKVRIVGRVVEVRHKTI